MTTTLDRTADRDVAPTRARRVFNPVASGAEIDCAWCFYTQTEIAAAGGLTVRGGRAVPPCRPALVVMASGDEMVPLCGPHAGQQGMPGR